MISLAGLSIASCSMSTNRVVIYICSEEEKISFFKNEISKQFPNYDVIFQSVVTGTLVSKLQSEGGKCRMRFFL